MSVIIQPFNITKAQYNYGRSKLDIDENRLINEISLLINSQIEENSRNGLEFCKFGYEPSDNKLEKFLTPTVLKKIENKYSDAGYSIRIIYSKYEDMTLYDVKIFVSWQGEKYI